MSVGCSEPFQAQPECGSKPFQRKKGCTRGSEPLEANSEPGSEPNQSKKISERKTPSAILKNSKQKTFECDSEQFEEKSEGGSEPF